MSKFKVFFKSRTYYKYFVYAVAFTSVNIGLCNAYLKRRKQKWIEKTGNTSFDTAKKVTFFLTKDDFEILEKEKYFYKIKKICKDFHVPLSKISKAANNYYPLDYHLQYVSSLFENKREDLKKIIENKNNEILDILIEEIQKHFEKHLKENTQNGSSLFLENVDFTHLKEFLLKRKKINIKSSTLLNEFLDEVYIYIYFYLLANYKRNNFFDFIRINRSYRHCSENSGKDIGLEVNNYLDFDKTKETDQHSLETEKNETETETKTEAKTTNCLETNEKENKGENFVDSAKYVLKIEKVNEITKILKEYGLVVLKNFFPKEEIKKIKKELFIEEKDSNISSYLFKKDQNIFCIRPTRGRQYCIIRNSKISDSFVNLQQYWLNLIYAYLPIGIYENVFNFLDKEKMLEENKLESMSIKNEYNDKLYLSELQLIHNEPLSEIQTYHVDNGLNGISLIIPLDKINEESGNWEFILGSHNFSSFKKKKLKKKIKNLKNFLAIYCKTNSSFIPNIEETDLVIYDSKILHRGLSNNLWKKNSTLIYRYDYKKYPPPGQDFINIFGYNLIGKCISFFKFLEKYF